jgi:hypothetical protein
MFFTPTRSCLMLILSASHSFPLSLALSPSLVHFLFSSPFWPFSHCQSTISLIFVPSLSDCIYWPTVLLLTAIPFLCSPLKIYFTQFFRLSVQFQPHFTSGYLLSAEVKEQHAGCTVQSKCHLQSPIPCADSYSDGWTRPRFPRTNEVLRGQWNPWNIHTSLRDHLKFYCLFQCCILWLLCTKRINGSMIIKPNFFLLSHFL